MPDSSSFYACWFFTYAVASKCIFSTPERFAEFLACQRSKLCFMANQLSGERPIALGNRNAISGLTELRPETNRVKVDAAAPRLSDKDLILISKGSMSVSRINSPGCGGLCIAISDCFHRLSFDPVSRGRTSISAGQLSAPASISCYRHA